jgi:hypothetical protein
MKLFLEDLKELSEVEIKDHISREYCGKERYDDRSEAEIKELRKSLNKYDILIAYESVGSWGCDSSSWFLLRDKKTGKLYETHGSHCSCYGFEGQWNLEETTVEYLKSDKFHFCTGGYDNNESDNQSKVKEYLSRLKSKQ